MFSGLPVKTSLHKRKREHLDIALTGDVSPGSISKGFDAYRFVHQALPEIDLSSVDTSTQLFGRVLKAPLLISPMVGGIEEAATINRNLAMAAQDLGLGMGVGSQRCALDDSESVSSYTVRDVAPDILLFANLGAVQLNHGYTVEHCRRAVDMIGADALMLHLNPLQEALQSEGNTDFAGLLKRIEAVCRRLEVPVIVKEIGFGISSEVASRLVAAGVRGIDVAGAGGTSFSRIETTREHGQEAEDAFSSWGIPTAESVKMVRTAAPDITLIASGGVRTGVEVAKSIALGADAAGIGAPLLKPASISHSEVVDCIKGIIKDLRISMFCAGVGSIGRLKNCTLSQG